MVPKRSSEDLDDDLKKGNKNSNIWRGDASSLQDFDKDNFWWKHIMKKTSSDGHVTLTSFVLFGWNVAFQFWSYFLSFFDHVKKDTKVFKGKENETDH